MGARGGDTVASVPAGHVARTPDAPSLVSVLTGVPDEVRDEAIHVHAVPHDRASASAGELLVHGRERLARFRVPDEVIFVDHLPRTSMGTIRTHLLRRGDATQGEDDTHDP